MALLTGACKNQKPATSSNQVTHILTAFNGMHAGFNANGSQKKYWAQATTMKGITDFASQDMASAPVYKFGFFEFVYTQANIQTKFSLPPTKDVGIFLSGTTSVDNSVFRFTLSKDGATEKDSILVPTPGSFCKKVQFKGGTTGGYDLTITAGISQVTSNTFIISELKIEPK